MDEYMYALAEWLMEIEEKLETMEFTPVVLIVALVGMALAAVIIFSIKHFVQFEYSESKGKFLLKLAIASVAPIAFCLPLNFEKMLPTPLVIVIEIISLVAVYIWELKNNKLFISFGHTIAYGLVGCCVGMLCVSHDLWMLGLIGFALSMVKGGVDLNKEISVSKSTPEYVTDSETGETYRVEKGSNGNTYIQKNGESVPIYNGAYANDYNDGNSSYHSN